MNISCSIDMSYVITFHIWEVRIMSYFDFLLSQDRGAIGSRISNQMHGHIQSPWAKSGQMVFFFYFQVKETNGGVLFLDMSPWSDLYFHFLSYWKTSVVEKVSLIRMAKLGQDLGVDKNLFAHFSETIFYCLQLRSVHSDLAKKSCSLCINGVARGSNVSFFSILHLKFLHFCLKYFLPF